jgi:hypothetical protein
MKFLVSKIKPAVGFAHLAHIALSALLPIAVYIFVRIELAQVALMIILLSKWRMLAVQPRFWWAHIRANAVDIVVGLSILAFMVSVQAITWQLIWMGVYILWLLFLKPKNDTLSVSLQAATGHVFGLSALFIVWSDASLLALVLGTWFITYISARHFFTNFEEPYTALFAHFWGYFSAAMTWILGHYLLFYNTLSQPTLLLTIIGYGLAALYYLNHKDRLTDLVRREFVFMIVAIVLIILISADWTDKAV